MSDMTNLNSETPVQADGPSSASASAAKLKLDTCFTRGRFEPVSEDGLIFDTDSYKVSHWMQQPAHTHYISTYFESRGGAYDAAVFTGLQPYLEQIKPVTIWDVEAAEAEYAEHGVPFNKQTWMLMIAAYGGYPPVRIQALREGTLVPAHTTMIQVVNTDPSFFWLPGHLETALMRMWYPITAATRSLAMKRIIRKWLQKTSDDPDTALKFALHDFGSRSASSAESARIYSAAHLIHFHGTDTYTGARYIRRYYGEPMAGYSIPAGEHGTITTWGRDNEEKAYAHAIGFFAQPGKTVALPPVDSYDLHHAVRMLIGTNLKLAIERAGGKIIIRPDSGEPTVIPVEVVEMLGQKFGYSENSRGYKLLPPFLKVLQGDGVNERSIDLLYSNLAAQGWSADNVGLGCGTELSQSYNRDTLKFAMKASAIKIGTTAKQSHSEMEWKDVYKDPQTDPGKASKRGRRAVVLRDGKITDIREDELGFDERNLLEDVYLNGKILRRQTFGEIRGLASHY